MTNVKNFVKNKHLSIYHWNSRLSMKIFICIFVDPLWENCRNCYSLPEKLIWHKEDAAIDFSLSPGFAIIFKTSFEWSKLKSVTRTKNVASVHWRCVSNMDFLKRRTKVPKISAVANSLISRTNCLTDNNYKELE